MSGRGETSPHLHGAPHGLVPNAAGVTLARKYGDAELLKERSNEEHHYWMIGGQMVRSQVARQPDLGSDSREYGEEVEIQYMVCKLVKGDMGGALDGDLWERNLCSATPSASPYMKSNSSVAPNNGRWRAAGGKLRMRTALSVPCMLLFLGHFL
jgi:hypothetical protein